MPTFRDSIPFDTEGEVEIRDLTSELADVIHRSGLRTGIACVFSSSSTSAITTLEYEPGLLQDLPRALERLFPKGLEYEHQKTWQDGNGHSHVRAAFLGPSLAVPFDEGRPVLGTWQQVVFVDLDNKPRRREVLVQLVGE
ncbi:MAG: secondary thiamine-phosphate synthase enzyme YjbQ [Thermoplasmata archaeon]